MYIYTYTYKRHVIYVKALQRLRNSRDMRKELAHQFVLNIYLYFGKCFIRQINHAQPVYVGLEMLRLIMVVKN